MNTKALVSVVLFVYSTLSCVAQSDTLSKSEWSQVLTSYRASSMNYYHLVDSFSNTGDSMNAGKYLLKINPLYMAWEWRNSERPDTFLATKSISVNAKNEFIESYKRALNSSKSAPYQTLEKMAIEDQMVRDMVSKCNDTNTCQKLNRKADSTDKVHFAYLYNYVKLNGWPSIENGSLNASIIAIHDHNNHKFYLPYITQAVKNGNAHISTLDIILFYLKMNTIYAEVDKKLHTNRKYTFDISSVLDHRLPGSLHRIQNAIQQNCSDKLTILIDFEVPDMAIYTDWFNKNPSSGKDNIITKLMTELQPYCEKKLKYGIWDVRSVISNKKRLIMYVVY